MSIRWIPTVIVALVLIAAGVWIWRVGDDRPTHSSGKVLDGIVQDESGRRVLYWYDPMVPQQRFEKPGTSPFMDMQLVPKYADETSDAGVQVTPSAQQNLGIRISPVERGSFGESIVAVGRLEVNERALHAVPSRVSGYVERLHVRAVGDAVSSGQIVAEIYSPELLSAQQEFLALHRARNLSQGSALVEAARERLRLLGMAPREIDALERSGTATPRFGVYSPANGFVVDLTAREGGQIEAGATLISIADLSSLWLIADVPERDAARIQPGDSVEARLEGVPGEVVSGKVDFIYPSLNAETRTARIRIVVPNASHMLRPGMFANVDISGVERDVLTVPSEAVIYTGERSVVIVKEGPGFRPAEVRTGAELAGRTEILAGLEEGEQVVASGQFLIDSEASLSGVLARLSGADETAAKDEHAGHAMDTETAPNAEQPTDPEHTQSHDHGDDAETPR